MKNLMLSTSLHQPVDSRETGLQKPETLVTEFKDPEDVKIFDGFKEMPGSRIKRNFMIL